MRQKSLFRDSFYVLMTHWIYFSPSCWWKCTSIMEHWLWICFKNKQASCNYQESFEIQLIYTNFSTIRLQKKKIKLKFWVYFVPEIRALSKVMPVMKNICYLICSLCKWDHSEHVKVLLNLVWAVTFQSTDHKRGFLAAKTWSVGTGRDGQ